MTDEAPCRANQANDTGEALRAADQQVLDEPVPQNLQRLILLLRQQAAPSSRPVPSPENGEPARPDRGAVMVRASGEAGSEAAADPSPSG